MMWLMLQQETPDDYVVGTGKSYTVREFVDKAFSYMGVRARMERRGTRGNRRSSSSSTWEHLTPGTSLSRGRSPVLSANGGRSPSGRHQQGTRRSSAGSRGSLSTSSSRSWSTATSGRSALKPPCEGLAGSGMQRLRLHEPRLFSIRTDKRTLKAAFRVLHEDKRISISGGKGRRLEFSP